MKNSQLKISANKPQPVKQNTASTYQKVKPVVVKHVLKNQIAPLADPKMQSQSLQGKESVRFSEASMSPRFYGQGQPPYFGKPEDVSRDLIQNLEKGMTQLKISTLKKENQDPQLSMLLHQQRSNNMGFSSQNQMINNYMPSYHNEFQTSNIQYGSSQLDHIISLEELDNLRKQNEDRIRSIEEKYFKRKEETRQVRDIIQERADVRETKEKHVDSSLSYPTYGRGVDPDPNINTYMINKNLCHDGQSPKKRFKLETDEDDGFSPSRDDRQKRPKIITPRRQKYETQFEKFMVYKYVEEQLKEKPPKPKETDKFDTVTKVEGSLNAKMHQKLYEEERKRRQDFELKKLQNKSLYQIENSIEKLLHEEALVILGQEVLDRLRAIFNSIIEESDPAGQGEIDRVDFNTLVATLAEDEFFQDFMQAVARKNIDGESETFEDLLNRVLNEHREDTISWLQFLGFFSKRGKLQGYNQLQISPTKGKTLTTADDEQGGDNLGENKQVKYQKQVKERLNYKQTMVPKEGKGKYNVTVPTPYDFQNREKTEKTIREQKLEQMLKEKDDKVVEAISYKFRANDIPKSTTKPLYSKLMKQKEERRQEVRRLSMAITKQTEKPFSFYTREKSRERRLDTEIPETMRHAPFRANKIPWKVLVPLYKRMNDKIEYEREQRIKKNAELSLSLAKLPPRMEEYEQKKKLQSQQEGYKTGRSNSLDMICTFQPPRAKPVPDFKRLQKQFQQSLENQRKSHSITEPTPFTFHQPKSTANMRQYLDLENQKINPTLREFKKGKGKSTIGRSQSLGESVLNRDNVKENPATTKKFEAYVESRRKDMEDKKVNEESKFQEEIQRFFKQNRLSQRVQCSPALVNTGAELKKRKIESIRRAKTNMKKLEKAWDDKKQEIEFNVANKPLLVEQVSKAFIRNLNQIRELQRYVNILREANLNPDEHLTEEQKELLLSAEYYDRLNAATAYFPSQMQGQQQYNQQEDMDGEEMEGEGEGEEEGEGEDDGEEEEEEGQRMIGQEPIEENQIEEDEEDDDNQNQDGNEMNDNDEEDDVQEDQTHSQQQENVNQENQESQQQNEEDEEEMDGEDDEGEEMVELDDEQMRQFILYQQHQQMLRAQHLGGGDMDEDDEDMQYEEEDDEEYEEDQQQ